MPDLIGTFGLRSADILRTLDFRHHFRRGRLPGLAGDRDPSDARAGLSGGAQRGHRAGGQPMTVQFVAPSILAGDFAQLADAVARRGGGADFVRRRDGRPFRAEHHDRHPGRQGAQTRGARPARCAPRDHQPGSIPRGLRPGRRGHADGARRGAAASSPDAHADPEAQGAREAAINPSTPVDSIGTWRASWTTCS